MAEKPHIQKKWRCKHCKVYVLGQYDFRPVLGSQHKQSCPRKRLNG